MLLAVSQEEGEVGRGGAGGGQKSGRGWEVRL